MPFSTTIKDVDTWGNYKSPFMNDLRRIDAGEIVKAHWAVAYRFPSENKPGQSKERALVILADSPPTALMAKAQANNKDKKLRADGSITARKKGEAWVTDSASLRDALAKLDVKAVQVVPSLEAHLATPPEPEKPARPAWEDAWDKGAKAFLQQLAKLPEDFAALRGEAADKLKAGRLQAAQASAKANTLLAQAIAGWMTSAKAALKKKVLDTSNAATWRPLPAPQREAARKPLEEAIDGTKLPQDLVGIAEALDVMLSDLLGDALKAHQSPGPDRWLKHLAIGERKIQDGYTQTYRIVAESQIVRPHWTVMKKSINPNAGQFRIVGMSADEVLQAVFVKGVATTAQAHATLDNLTDADRPHLYLDGTYDPKKLKGADIAGVRALLQPVHGDLVTWLRGRITALQAQLAGPG